MSLDVRTKEPLEFLDLGPLSHPPYKIRVALGSLRAFPKVGQRATKIERSQKRKWHKKPRPFNKLRLSTCHIQKLPVELLQNIFEHYSESDSFQSVFGLSLTLPGVCRTWRETALNLPSIWAFIRINLAVMQASPRRNYALPVQQALQRSKTRVLHVQITLAGHDFRRWASLFDILRSSCHRWASFYYNSNVGQGAPTPPINVTHNHTREFTALETVTLENLPRLHDRNYSDFLHSLVRHTPRLNEVFLIDDQLSRLDFILQWPSNPLANLDLSGRGEIKGDWLISVLRRCTSLQVLRASCLELKSRPMTYENITLPRLRILLATNAMSFICSILTVPALVDLTWSTDTNFRDVREMIARSACRLQRLSLKAAILRDVSIGTLLADRGLDLTQLELEGHFFDHLFTCLASPSSSFLPSLKQLVIGESLASPSTVVKAIRARAERGRLDGLKISIPSNLPDLTLLNELETLPISIDIQRVPSQESHFRSVLRILGRKKGMNQALLSENIQVIDNIFTIIERYLPEILGQNAPIVEVHTMFMTGAYNMPIPDSEYKVKERARNILGRLNEPILSRLKCPKAPFSKG
ncbi:hypothetical protein PM082_011442 [Marasmius tenuissimus]|nr:hypothetical protein PM082_011442 [Marasmius tenuissimus]